MSKETTYGFDEDGEFVVREQETTQVLPPYPGLWQVILLNDEYNPDVKYTPMFFVVEMLKKHFNHDEKTAIQIMIKILKQGEGIAGVYSRDVAETKATLVTDESSDEGYPLTAVIRKND